MQSLCQQEKYIDDYIAWDVVAGLQFMNPLLQTQMQTLVMQKPYAVVNIDVEKSNV